MLGLGIDVVVVLRIQRVLNGPLKQRFLKRVLHANEMQLMQRHHNPVQYVAGCWAAKEALFKSLDPQDQRGFTFNEWRRTYAKGKPTIGLDGYKRPEEFMLTISHDGGILVATVLRKSA